MRAHSFIARANPFWRRLRRALHWSPVHGENDMGCRLTLGPWTERIAPEMRDAGQAKFDIKTGRWSLVERRASR